MQHTQEVGDRARSVFAGLTPTQPPAAKPQRPARETNASSMLAKSMMATMPIVLAGTVLAFFRAEIPYIPTAKAAVRGRFVRLAWPQFLLLAVFAMTIVRVVYERLYRTSEGALELGSEAVWGMIAFAAIPVGAAIATLYAAWESTRLPAGMAWDVIDVDVIGGDQA